MNKKKYCQVSVGIHMKNKFIYFTKEPTCDKILILTIFSLREYRKTLLTDQFNVLIVEYWLLLVHHNTDCLVRH